MEKYKEFVRFDNTISQKTKQRKFYPGRDYAITIYDYEYINKMIFNKSQVDYFFGKLEQGEKKGKLHYQCFIQLKKKISSIFDFQYIIGCPSMDFHASLCHSTADNNDKYCQKLETTVLNEDGKPQLVTFGTKRQNDNEKIKITDEELHTNFQTDVEKGMNYKDLMSNHKEFLRRYNKTFHDVYNAFKPQKLYPIKRTFENTELKPYQKRLLNFILSYDIDDMDTKRILKVVLDRQGAAAKTTTAKMIYNHFTKLGKVCQVIDTTKKADLAYAVREDVDIIIFDLARFLEGHMNFEAIESIINGSIFSNKYASVSKIFNKQPIVILMTNTLPHDLYEKLSIDRISLLHLTNKGGLCSQYDDFTIDTYKQYYNDIYNVDLKAANALNSFLIEEKKAPIETAIKPVEIVEPVEKKSACVYVDSLTKDQKIAYDKTDDKIIRTNGKIIKPKPSKCLDLRPILQHKKSKK